MISLVRNGRAKPRLLALLLAAAPATARSQSALSAFITGGIGIEERKAMQASRAQFKQGAALGAFYWPDAQAAQ